MGVFYHRYPYSVPIESLRLEQQVLERCAKEKAWRQWRLVIVDGHGSHLTREL
jgi:hypothetical protein